MGQNTAERHSELSSRISVLDQNSIEQYSELSSKISTVGQVTKELLSEFNARLSAFEGIVLNQIPQIKSIVTESVPHAKLEEISNHTQDAIKVLKEMSPDVEALKKINLKQVERLTRQNQSLIERESLKTKTLKQETYPDEQKKHDKTKKEHNKLFCCATRLLLESINDKTIKSRWTVWE
jgi:hypothetical protein